MKFTDGMAAIEAVLFACGEPIELDKLAAAVEIEQDTAERIIERLNNRYKEQKSAFVIGKLGDSFQMMTRPELARYIKSAMETRRQAPLTQAALEVLAIVAYNQPITRAFVDQVRGVDSSGVVRSLVERDLLEEHGRLNDVPGRPIAYRTTENFLRCFGFSSLDELPPIPGSTDQLNLEDYEDLDYSDSSEDAAPAESDDPTMEDDDPTGDDDNPAGEDDPPGE